jgi:hypothetical protein
VGNQAQSDNLGAALFASTDGFIVMSSA